VKGSHHVPTTKLILLLSAKMDGKQRTLDALCVLRYVKKYQATEAMSNSEKIKPVALAIVGLCWSEGIRQF